MTNDTLFSIEDIARELNTPVRRVRNIVRTRRQIRPVSRSGVTLLFTRRTMEVIRREVEQIEGRGKANDDDGEDESRA